MFTLRRPAVYVPLAVAVLAFVVGALALASHGGGSLLSAGRANCPPVARNDAAFTAPDQAVRINVLANDTDVDGDRLQFQVINVSAGTAEVDFAGAGAQTLLYEPSTPDGTRATVKYRVRDPAGDVSTAVVAIAVTTSGQLPAGLASAALGDNNGEVVEARCLKLAKRPEASETATATATTATTTPFEPYFGEVVGMSSTGRGSNTTTKKNGTASSPNDAGDDFTVDFGDTHSPDSGSNAPHSTTSHPPTTQPTASTNPCYDGPSCQKYYFGDDDTTSTTGGSTDTTRTTRTTDPCDGDNGCPDEG
jgi:hypothetical protein